MISLAKSKSITETCAGAELRIQLHIARHATCFPRPKITVTRRCCADVELIGKGICKGCPKRECQKEETKMNQT